MRVITTVGTSIFANYNNKVEVIRNYPDLKKDYAGITTQVDNLENKPASDFTNSLYEGDIEYIREVIHYLWLEIAHEKSCAELQTLFEIAKEETNKEENTTAKLEVFLLATDTILSVLACELIKEWLNEQSEIHDLKVSCLFNNDINAPDTMIVKGLQVEDAGKFRELGVDNLLGITNRLTGKDKNLIFNISGGYKALIPYITLYAQLKEIPLKYLYEDSNTLISVPNLPFSLDPMKVHRYYLLLQDGKDFLASNRQKNNKGAQILVDECIEWGLLKKTNKIEPTTLGKLFIDRTNNFFDIGKSNLGFFVEHKLFEYFHFYDELGKKSKVLHSVEIEAMEPEATHKPKGNEIDILLETKDAYLFNEIIREGKRANEKPQSGAYIPIEVKPLGRIDVKQYESFLLRIANLWLNHFPKEVRIILYSFFPVDYAIHKFINSNISRMKKCAEMVATILGEVPFRVQLVNIDIAFSEKNEISDDFMQHPLTKEHFIQELFFINGELQN